ncbi:chorismate-binding protein [Cellulomonas endophytica]|uniref:chorismate-binding protein n=1 Tax=Cellulomonas endophytica TaxID=2494735 RepID=UPI00101163CD|nr:chorismate-binding protein [Cellulomonas endophytica]
MVEHAGAAAAPGTAWFGGRVARGVVEDVDVLAAPERLRTPGLWALVGTFEGDVHAWRFAEVAPGPVRPVGGWRGPSPGSWVSSLDAAGYRDGVRAVRSAVREGRVYQANLCRVLAAPLPLGRRGGDAAGGSGEEPDAAALAAVLAAGNPAPFAGGVHVPGGGRHRAAWVVSASPELFLRVGDGRVLSSPIKGTAPTGRGLTAKDRAENVMITDLVRNDLQRVSRPGSVWVEDLLRVEAHPGLVHLVSTVAGDLEPAVLRAPDLWRRLLEATYPPGSVSGAPKGAALELLAGLEPVPRGPYCGTVGWVEVDPDGGVRAELAVAIRTFWWDRSGGGTLRFGTGAGITWGSEPDGEWAETELKAARLVGLASGVR